MDNTKINELDSFSKLLAKWLIEGKLWISPFIGNNDEPMQNGLELLITFAGGDEVIGNEHGASFTWHELFDMAKEQGLL